MRVELTAEGLVGRWTPEADACLVSLCDAEEHRPVWSKIAEEMRLAGYDRSQKQCRERWMEHLRPGILKGKWSDAELHVAFAEFVARGPRWTEIATLLPGRTANSVKNRINTLTSRRPCPDMALLLKSGFVHKLGRPPLQRSVRRGARTRVRLGKPDEEGPSGRAASYRTPERKQKVSRRPRPNPNARPRMVYAATLGSLSLSPLGVSFRFAEQELEQQEQQRPLGQYEEGAVRTLPPSSPLSPPLRHSPLSPLFRHSSMEEQISEWMAILASQAPPSTSAQTEPSQPEPSHPQLPFAPPSAAVSCVEPDLPKNEAPRGKRERTRHAPCLAAEERFGCQNQGQPALRL